MAPWEDQFPLQTGGAIHFHSSRESSGRHTRDSHDAWELWIEIDLVPPRVMFEESFSVRYCPWQTGFEVGVLKKPPRQTPVAWDSFFIFLQSVHTDF